MAACIFETTELRVGGGQNHKGDTLEHPLLLPKEVDSLDAEGSGSFRIASLERHHPEAHKSPRRNVSIADLAEHSQGVPQVIGRGFELSVILVVQTQDRQGAAL